MSDCNVLKAILDFVFTSTAKQVILYKYTVTIKWNTDLKVLLVVKKKVDDILYFKI